MTDQETERLLAMGQSSVGEIKNVKEHDTVWVISYDGYGMGLSKKYGVKPEVGQRIRVYTYQGSLIRGVDLDDETVFFMTAEEVEEDQKQRRDKYVAEQKQKFKEQREELDATVASLPEPFQRRIQWFRDHNPDFRWEWEAYELSSCVDAVKIAEWAKEQAAKVAIPPFSKTPHENINWFRELPSDDQRKQIPDLTYDDHSGNTFSAAVMLALHYVIDPEWVFYDHGVGVPLAGCEDYGCHHPRPGVDEFVARHQPEEAKDAAHQ